MLIKITVEPHYEVRYNETHNKVIFAGPCF